MQYKFKRHQNVILLSNPDPEFIEYHSIDEENLSNIPITKGMKGRINMILPNGKYHIEIHDSKGEIIAYAPMDEESLASEEN